MDHYDRLIREMPEPPILIGRSFGGLFVQKLLDRGLGAVGVAIEPAAPKGVAPTLTVLWGALPVFRAWMGWKRALKITFSQFAWSFVHLLPRQQQLAEYERNWVPTPGRIYYQSAFGIETEVNFANTRRALLLLIAGELDRTVAQSMVQKTYEKYRASKAIREFRSFPGRTHFLIGTPGWEEVADYAINWAKRNSIQMDGSATRLTSLNRHVS